MKCENYKQYNVLCQTCDYPNKITCNKTFEENTKMQEEVVMKDELKPCPFCGEDADKTYNTVHGFQVYCSNVECILNDLLMVGMDTEEDSFNAWNQRK